MSEFIASITILSVLALGLANVVLLTRSISATKRTKEKVWLSIGFILAFILCYFMTRAGYVSDEQRISGSDVPPFYGTEWYFLIAVGIIMLAYQTYLVRKYRSV